MIFQLLFTCFVLLAVLMTLQTAKRHSMSMYGAMLWVCLWSIALVVVWAPEGTNYIAQTLGIGRGVDVVLYSSVPLVFFLLFRFHIKLSNIEAKITRVVRDEALKEVIDQ